MSNAQEFIDWLDRLVGVDEDDVLHALDANGIAGLSALAPGLSNVMTLQGSGAPVNYTDGTPPATGEGIAAPGSTYTDYTNAIQYINVGTKAEPTWAAMAAAGQATLAGYHPITHAVLWLEGAGAPVDYTDGTPPATGEGTAEIGSIYSDRTAGKVYVNGGTMAEPLWKLVTSA